MLKKKSKPRGITSLDFKPYYKAIIIKTGTGTKQTHRSMEQNREPEMDPQLNGQLIFDKAGKNVQGKKDSVFSK